MDCGSWVYRCELRDDEVRVEEGDPCAHTEQSSSTWRRLLKHSELQIRELGSHVSCTSVYCIELQQPFLHEPFKNAAYCLPVIEVNVDVHCLCY